MIAKTPATVLAKYRWENCKTDKNKINEIFVENKMLTKSKFNYPPTIRPSDCGFVFAPIKLAVSKVMTNYFTNTNSYD